MIMETTRVDDGPAYVEVTRQSDPATPVLSAPLGDYVIDYRCTSCSKTSAVNLTTGERMALVRALGGNAFGMGGT